MKLLDKKSGICIMLLFIVVVFFIPLCFGLPVSAQTTQDVISSATVNTTSTGLASKVAPGEFLPIAVKLSNFGGGQRVDVTVTYGIFNGANKSIYATTETVAVETTASFIKNIQIPRDTAPGKYIAKASLVYQGQLVPATTQFSFTVENKIFGIFLSDFYFYLIWLVIVAVITATIVYFWIKRQSFNRLNPHEYPKIPKKDRIYYEIISDTIMQMRLRVGDKALIIAKNIDNLVIDQDNGRVLQIKVNPAAIVAELISSYEKLLGQKVSFAMNKIGKPIGDHVKNVDKNLVTIKKQ